MIHKAYFATNAQGEAWFALAPASLHVIHSGLCPKVTPSKERRRFHAIITLSHEEMGHGFEKTGTVGTVATRAGQHESGNPARRADAVAFSIFLWRLDRALSLETKVPPMFETLGDAPR